MWSANSRCYSNVQTVREELIHRINVAGLTARERRVYEAAYRRAYEIQNVKVAGK